MPVPSPCCAYTVLVHAHQMAIMTNRLPFMDLKELCDKEGFAYACVWRPWAGKGQTELQLDALAVSKHH